MQNQSNNQNNSIPKKPFYLQTWFISIFFIFSFFVIPFFVGLALLIKQISFDKSQNEKYKMIGDADTYKNNTIQFADEMKKQAEIDCQNSRISAENYATDIKQKAELECQNTKLLAENYATDIKQQVELECKNTKAAADNYAADVRRQADEILKKSEELKNQTELECKKSKLDADNYFSRINQKSSNLKNEISNLRFELDQLSENLLIQTTMIPIDNSITSEEYKSKYNILLIDEKEIIKSGHAIKDLNIKGINKKNLNNSIKQLLRSFNSEVSNALSSITVKNIDSVKSKILKTYETLNKLFETSGVCIRKEFLELKLKQADFMYSYEYQKEQERLQQKAIKEQMIEEEKVRREIEKEKSKIEKEERQFKNEINKLMEYLRKSSDIEKQLYVDKIKELEEKLALVEKDKENVLNREQNTRAGYVYIISNIGSFGDDVYKIGMTRRLEPMDRINELSSASVPFEFDVHAMIFSEDAPTLENTLHKYFDSYRVNKVNPRKEFYKVSLSDIEKVVKENFNGTVTFTKVAEAYQYRESLRLSQQI